MLIDNYGRALTYLRLAVTDRCNLRCAYCMPAKGLNWIPRKSLMTDEEMFRLCAIMVGSGIDKIRITGGEPFIRKGMMNFLNKLSGLPGLQKITVTTNGVLTAPLIPELKKMGIHSINLSLDTLDRERFKAIANRDELPKVLKTLEALLSYDIPVKINTVVMEHRNIEDLIPLILLSKTLPVDIRFIEEMPFNGGNHKASLTWNHKRILAHIKDRFPAIQKIPDLPHATSSSYRIPGHKGNVGIIAAYSRLFCGSCNRIRITPEGMLRTCLYDDGTWNLKEALRKGLSDADMKTMITGAIAAKAKDGWEAEKNRQNKKPVQESMATVGG